MMSNVACVAAVDDTLAPASYNITTQKAYLTVKITLQFVKYSQALTASAKVGRLKSLQPDVNI